MKSETERELPFSILAVSFVTALGVVMVVILSDSSDSDDGAPTPLNPPAIERRASDMPYIYRPSRAKTKTLRDTLADDKKLLSAIQKNDPSALQPLLAEGADPNARDHEGNTPLMLACIWGDSRTNIVALLLQYEADIHATNHHGDNALSYCNSNQPHGALTNLLRAAGATSRWDNHAP